MLQCPSCQAQRIQPAEGCHACGFKPLLMDGFLAWAPELAEQNDGFPKDSFAKLVELESGNFWFRARNRIICWALDKYFPDLASLLEIGCGTGFVLSGISTAFPQARIVGSEIYVHGLAFAAARLPKAELLQMDARKMPYREEFDVVCAFDVIEHIAEDQRVLENLYRAVKPGGGCIITVPQHPWLWSQIDVTACHQRRYRADDLHAKARAAGFKILKSTSFVTLLLPLMLASRLAKRKSEKPPEAGSEFQQISPTINRILKIVMWCEFQLLRLGLPLPIGGSRLLVLQREANP